MQSVYTMYIFYYYYYYFFSIFLKKRDFFLGVGEGGRWPGDVCVWGVGWGGGVGTVAHYNN